MTAILAPILFATTNVAKFMQAKLVLGWGNFVIQRLESHRSPYAEPYGLPRAKFLTVGLEEVVSRAGPNRLVFIEDTTVCFPSLSHDEEYPGQETKEWFAKTRHEELLTALNMADGGREVIVRSDIALHVPGLSKPVFLAATTEGVVVDNLGHVTENNLYPWLGQPDFSSWFVPSGASKVLAEMQLEESLPYDFRAKALSLLVERLREYSAAINLPVSSVRKVEPRLVENVDQEALFDIGRPNLVLIVIGRMASGKSTVGHFLELYRHFTHIEGSRALTETAAKYHIEGDSNFDIADQLFREFGYDIVEREVVAPRLQHENSPIVYTGCRTIEGVATLKRVAHELNLKTAVMYISSPSSVRLSHASDRGRGEVTRDPLKFEEISARDEAYGAGLLGPYVADVEIANQRDLNSFLSNIGNVVDLLKVEHRPLSRPNRRTALAARLDKDHAITGVALLLERLSKELLPAAPLEDLALSNRRRMFVKLVCED